VTVNGINPVTALQILASILHQGITFSFTEVAFESNFIPRNFLNMTFSINL